MKIDVRFGNRGMFYDNPPLMRELTSWKITTKKGTGSEKGQSFRWLHWYWKPEPKTGEAHSYDCGFSGVRDDHREFYTIKKALEAAQ